MITTERALRLAGLLLLMGCHSGTPEAAPGPRPPRVAVLPAGARIRADVPRRGELIGRVLEATDTTSRSVIIVPDDAGASAPDTLWFDALRSLDVRGKSGGSWARFGLYAGGFTGAMIRSPDKAEDSGPMLLGMLGGALLGAFVGSRVESWLPVFPCYHGCAGTPQR